MRPQGSKIRSMGGARVKNLVKQLGLHLKRKYGQNFLIDEAVLDYIADAAELTPGDRVLEVGTGLGNLTKKLAESGARVLSCEIDPTLAAIASQELAPCPNVRILAHDALDGHGNLSKPLTAALDELLGGGGRLKVVSNLPYCVATPIITAFVEGSWPVERLVLTIQKEVGERLVAQRGTRDYSYLGVVVQLQCEARLLRGLAPGSFWPKPDVRSAIVCIKPKSEEERVDEATLKGLKRVANAIFRMRRKTLLNALDGVPAIPGDRAAIAAAIERAELDPGVRGEQLTPQQMVQLAQALELTG